MKVNLLFVMVVLFPSITILAQANKSYTIKAKIKGIPDGTKFYLIKSAKTGGADTVETVLCKNGIFSFHGSLKREGELHFVKMDTMHVRIPNGHDSWVRVLLENRNLSIRGNLNEWPNVELLGSDATHLFETVASVASVYDKNIIDYSIRKDTLSIKTTAFRYKQHLDSLIQANSNSTGAAAVLYFFKKEVITQSEQELIFGKLANVAKNSYYGNSLKKNFLFANERKNIKEDGTIPNFYFYAQSGNEVSIIDAVKDSKYTLIDFWAPWCKPCRDEIPNLDRLLKKYKKAGFNIIGIGVMDNIENWSKTVKDINAPWIQGYDAEADITSLFGFNSLPAYVLVSGNGKLIAYQCGSSSVPIFGGSIRGEDLESRLKELLNP